MSQNATDKVWSYLPLILELEKGRSPEVENKIQYKHDVFWNLIRTKQIAHGPQIIKTDK